MRETPRAYGRRTGASYQPPDWLTARARPLAPGQSCPTLFRYPGPLGLAAFLDGDMELLAPTPGGRVWLSASRTPAELAAVRQFGTLAVLQPLRLDACRTPQRGVWLGVNRPLPEQTLAWIPPSALRARLPWDGLRERDAAEARLARWIDRDRSRVRDALGRYLEELRALERAGARAPRQPWCRVSQAARRRLLSRHGVSPSWSRSTDAA